MSDNHSAPETKYSLERELLLLRKSQNKPHQNFLEEQAVILRKLNAITSLDHKLPVETLNAIFLHATAPLPRPSYLTRRAKQPKERDLRDIFFSLVLASVCSRWRSVAFSTPTLWTRFVFPESLWKYQRAPCHLLSLYLHNSGHLPVHLTLSFKEQVCRDPNGPLFHSSVDHSLISNSARIRSLSLYNPPLRWFKQLGKLPFVVELSIEWQYYIAAGAKNRLQIHHCHALTCLSISNARTEGNRRILYQVPTSLTILDVSETPIDITIKTMLRCPNLIEAYIHEPRPVQDNDLLNQEVLQAWFPQPVVFDHLTTLLWTQCASACADAFLRQIKTPQLRTLKLISNDGGLDFIGTVSVIEQLPTTLKTWEFEGLSVVSAGLARPLSHTQFFAEHLITSRCTLDALSSIFQAPPGPGLGSFPRINSLSIRDCVSRGKQELDEVKSRELEPIIRSLERRLGQGDRFILELSGFGVDWMPSAQARLRRLVDKGVHLEIIEDEGQVEWLRPI